MSELIRPIVSEEDEYYKTINLYSILDKNLSWKAKGLHVYIMTRPKDWKIWIKDLVNQSPGGGTIIYSGLKELAKYKYLYNISVRDEKKKIIEWK